MVNLSQKILLAIYGAFLTLLPGGVIAEDIKQSKDSYFTGAQVTLAQKLAQRPVTTPARNIILFIGDGMGPSTVTAMRVLDGQLKGGPGEENILSWEEFPYTALSKTYNINQQIPDSAGTASAILSGAKTNSWVISVNKSVPRGDCKASRGNHLDSFLELSEQAGLNTGIISTARLTHATPAAAYAHSAHRYWEADGDIPVEERQYGCKDIALQFLDFNLGNGIELAFAGGRHNFLPTSFTDEEGEKGRRKDGRNLISEWQKKHAKGQYIWNSDGFNKLDLDKDGPILGLFNASHMQYEADRADDKGGEPSLAEMTEKAIDILAKKGGGYFLYIEGARIDHGHHDGNAYRALHDGVALAKAVEMARNMTDAQDTLIIVTADHSHGFVMTGDATRGNPILGKLFENDKRGNAEKTPALGEDNKPYTTLGYYNGNADQRQDSRPDLTKVNTQDKDFKQQIAVPTGYERHSGEDVAIYADGPYAYLFHGVVEQNYIFHVMQHAARREERSK